MEFLKAYKTEIDQELNTFFDQYLIKIKDTAEKNLWEAMQYALTNGGKRIRPILGLLCFELFPQKTVSRNQAIKVLLSLEFLHAYSLVHDDLPMMDNDEMRRGVPTVWKQYDEVTALMAGDGLNTLAFENIADAAPEHCVSTLVKILAKNSGINGMVGGQMRDMFFENQESSLIELQATHQKKTGALIIASAQFGAILAEASPEVLSLITQYAEKIGLAFQIKDDLLDVEGDELLVGKKVGKDHDSKGFIKHLGIEKSKERLNQLITESKEIAKSLRSEKLEQLASFIETRQY